MNATDTRLDPHQLRARDLCRHYRSGPALIRALDNVSLAIRPGEFLAVVGASGSGKSTLLNLLAGLDSPTSGTVEVRARALSSLTRRALARYRAREVGMVFQSFNLIAHFTALQNVELALFFGDTPRRARRARALAVLKQLGLADRATHRPADLSGGEQQRVALARALVKEPSVLFADEPTGNLDHENAAQIAAILRDLNAAGLTVVLVTHDLGFAARCAERVVRMHYGRLTENASTGPRGDSAP